MRTEAYKCDGTNCQHVKGLTNHWWVAIKANGSLLIKPWTDSAAASPAVLHFCGESCVQKTVSEFLTPQPRKNGETERVRPLPEHAPVHSRLVFEGSDGARSEETETDQERSFENGI